MLLHIKSYLYLAGRRCAKLVCLSATNWEKRALHGVVREREHTIQLLGFTPHVGPTWPPYTTSTKYILYLDFLTAFSIFILSFVSQELPSTVEVIYRSSPKVHLCSPEKRRGRREREGGMHGSSSLRTYLLTVVQAQRGVIHHLACRWSFLSSLLTHGWAWKSQISRQVC